MKIATKTRSPGLRTGGAALALGVGLGALGAGACEGEGGAGCGVDPLPKGFPSPARIENAAGVRITESGFAFLNEHLAGFVASAVAEEGGGRIVEGIPEFSGEQAGLKYTICPGGPDLDASPPRCAVDLDFAELSLSLSPEAPHDIEVKGSLAVRIEDLPVEVVYLLVPDTFTVVMNGSPGACPGDPQPYAHLPFSMRLSVETDREVEHARAGYSRVRLDSVEVDAKALEEALGYCDGTLTAAALAVLEPVVVEYLVTQLTSGLESEAEEDLFCLRADPSLDPSCPADTHDVGGICRYAPSESAPCASFVLGAEGRADFSVLTRAPSAGLDFLFAAGGKSPRGDGSGFGWGDLNPVEGGATIGLYGGAEPSPISGCVSPAKLPLPSGIALPDVLLGNAVEGWPEGFGGPHVGVAFSERYVNHLLGALYDAGAFCLAITGEQVPQLNTATLSLLAPSISELGLQREPQPVAIVVRLGAPPRVDFGGGKDIESDPLVRLSLEGASFDVYAFSLDRYVRAFTASFDFALPMNLVVTPEGLVPEAGALEIGRAEVKHAELLADDPSAVAETLAALIASTVAQAVGQAPPIPLAGGADAVGLTLALPESTPGKGSPGLGLLRKGGDDFLGFFAKFSVGGGAATLAEAGAATLVSKRVEPGATRLSGMSPENAPSITISVPELASAGGRAAWVRVGTGPYRVATRGEAPGELVLRDDLFRLQGEHRISVRTRAEDGAFRLSELAFQIDVDPPELALEARGGAVLVRARDAFSPREALSMRSRIAPSAFSAWTALGSPEAPALPAPGEGERLEVEVRDREGNVARAALSADAPSAGSSGAEGASCTAAGGRGRGGAAALLAAATAAMAAGARRRRKR